MKQHFLFILVCSLFSIKANAQFNYNDSIKLFQKDYKTAFIIEERSPLKKADTGYIRFFPIDQHYRVRASISIVANQDEFEMITHNGKKKRYRHYAIAKFVLEGQTYQLHLYQSLQLLQQNAYQKHLFLPFNDLTNYETTYAGGRYLDLSTEDIHNGTLVIDFNKCYNPYCAFKEGYSCPIPPVENRLNIRIEAGEQLFAGKVSE
jgi:uncharacterized protein (DUF1684 family)